MSWFRNDLEVFEDLDPDCRIEDEFPDEEIAEGVTLARRSLFWLSAAGVSSVLAGRHARGQDAAVDARSAPPVARDFGDFLSEVHPLARAQVRGGGEGESTYLMSVAAALTRTTETGSGVREAMRAFRDEHGREGERFPIAAVVMDLRPGGGFTHHDHRDYNGIILGLGGEVRIRNYDILGDVAVPPKGTTFQVRETRDDLVLPGRFSMLARRAENVHDLVAGPEGARVLDLFTYYAKGARSYFMDVDAEPRDEERRIHDAAWS